jgi:hypothetical protein
MRRPLEAAVILLALVAFSHAASAAPQLWQSLGNVFLRIDDQGVKNWNVFQVEKEKKEQQYLIQIANRFLLVDAERKQVFDLAPEKIKHDGAGLLWDPDDKPAKPLATSEWVVRDVGFAQRIKMRLNAENHTLDLQIPHPASRP